MDVRTCQLEHHSKQKSLNWCSRHFKQKSTDGNMLVEKSWLEKMTVRKSSVTSSHRKRQLHFCFAIHDIILMLVHQVN